MFCRHCNTQFSDTLAGRCPSCGRNGSATPVEGGIPAYRVHSDLGLEAVPTAPPPSEALEAQKSLAGRLPPSPVEGPSSEEPPTRTEEPADLSWAPGARIAGKYEVVGRLGSGGFGTVYKVRHVFRKKYYALKTPHPQFLRDEVFRRRFEREIEAMERFVHPDAVMIRDSGVTPFGIPYYTMDFIEGESLKAVLQRERRLSPARSLAIVRRVLRVLEVAHQNQIIHRDIKPDNILLTRARGGEQVKVLDFGVAKLLDLVGGTTITHKAQVGTPRYMSPEQITGERIDLRSDLFSLGIISYELVTGEHPFARERDPIQVTAAILNTCAVPPRDLVPDLPPELSEWILWMLEKKPKKRPQSARAALEALPDLEVGRSRSHLAASPRGVHPGAPRRGVEGLVLRQDTAEGERRSFLLFKERVSFGRSSRRGGENDLILRCLPCRSRGVDGENWRRNLTISRRLGLFYPYGKALVVEPDPQAAGGLSLSGVRSLEPAWIQADCFHLSLGERALEIDGYRRLRLTDRADFDLSFLSRGRPPGIRRPASIGYSQSGCEIDHVHLRRANNFPLHEYFLVFRQLALGSAAGAGLCPLGEGIEGEHALIILEAGEAFLAPAEGKLRIVRPAGLPGEKEEVALMAGELYPLVPGIEILVGPARLLVEAPAPEWFKQV